MSIMMDCVSRISNEGQMCWLRLICLALYVFSILMESESTPVPNETVKNEAKSETSSSELHLVKYTQTLEELFDTDEVNLIPFSHSVNQTMKVKDAFGEEEDKHINLLQSVWEKYLSLFSTNKSTWHEFPSTADKTRKPEEKSDQSVSMVSLSGELEKGQINADLPYSSVEKRVRHPCHCARHLHPSKSNYSHSCTTNEEDTFVRLDESEGSGAATSGESEVNSPVQKKNKMPIARQQSTEAFLITHPEDTKNTTIAKPKVSSNESGKRVGSGRRVSPHNKNPYNLKNPLHQELQLTTSYKNLNDDRDPSSFKKSSNGNPHRQSLLTRFSRHRIVSNFRSYTTLKSTDKLSSVQSQEASRLSLHNPTIKIVPDSQVHPSWNTSDEISQTARTGVSLEDGSFPVRKLNNEYEELPHSHERMLMSSPSPFSSRADLIKHFKMSHPLNTWASFGLFNERFFEKVDSHWLSYGPASPYTHTLLGATYAVLMAIGVGGNLLVVLMFIRCRSLRTPPNYLIVNLAVSDCLMMLKMPIFIVNSAYTGPVLGLIGCRIYGFVGGLSGTVSIMTLSAIAVDRYTVIAYPLNPMKRTTSSKALAMVGAVWIYSIFFACLPILGVNGYVPEGYLTSCSFDYLSQHTSDRLFVFVYFLAAFVVPLSMIVFSYVKIYRTVHTAERQELFTPVSPKGIVQLGRESFKCKRDTKKHKTEMKIAMLSSTIIIVWLVAWTPYAVVSLLGIFGYKRLLTPLASAIPSLFCKTAGCIDPFLYAIKHPRFQRELRAKLPLFLCRGNSWKRTGSCRNKLSPSNSCSEAARNLLDATTTTRKNRVSSSVTSTPLPQSRNSSSRLAGSCSSSPASLVVTVNLKDINGSRVTARLLRNPKSIIKQSRPDKSSLRRESNLCQCKKRNGEQGFNLNLKTDSNCDVCSRHSSNAELQSNKYNILDFEHVYCGNTNRESREMFSKLCNEPSVRFLESQCNHATPPLVVTYDSMLERVEATTLFPSQLGCSKLLYKERKKTFARRCPHLPAKKINVLFKEDSAEVRLSCEGSSISSSQESYEESRSDSLHKCNNSVNGTAKFCSSARVPYETTIM